jgi:hypothetical protein
VEAHGTARLADDIPAQRALTAVVPRRQITDALLDSERSPALLLDIDRRREGGEAERSTISIAWSRDELEKLLDRATSDEVALAFDRDELAFAFDDVEAHGLRERAVVCAVVAAGTLGSGAAIANATPISEPGAAGAVPVTSTAPVGEVSAGGLITSDHGVLSIGSAVGGGPAVSNVHTPGLQIGDEGAAPVQASGPSADSETMGIPTRDLNDALIAGGVLLAIAGATFVGARRVGTARPA